MSTEPHTLDTRTDVDPLFAAETEPYCDCSSDELCSVVVEYEDSPDRRTVYPDGLGSVERMSTWLTADDDAFVELDRFR